jgi:hypothetical protein
MTKMSFQRLFTNPSYLILHDFRPQQLKKEREQQCALVGPKDEHPRIYSNVVEWNIIRVEPDITNRAACGENNVVSVELSLAKLSIFCCRNEHRRLKVEPIRPDVLRVSLWGHHTYFNLFPCQEISTVSPDYMARALPSCAPTDADKETTIAAIISKINF